MQARDAYACYLNSQAGLKSKGIAEEPVTAKLPKLTSTAGGMNPHLTQRISFLQTHLANAPMPSVTSQ